MLIGAVAVSRDGPFSLMEPPMFSMQELEAALALVHGAFGPTPSYRWPLLAHG